MIIAIFFGVSSCYSLLTALTPSFNMIFSNPCSPSKKKWSHQDFMLLPCVNYQLHVIALIIKSKLFSNVPKACNFANAAMLENFRGKPWKLPVCQTHSYTDIWRKGESIVEKLILEGKNKKQKTLAKFKLEASVFSGRCCTRNTEN